jgi:hypothetical protein
VPAAERVEVALGSRGGELAASGDPIGDDAVIPHAARLGAVRLGHDVPPVQDDARVAGLLALGVFKESIEGEAGHQQSSEKDPKVETSTFGKCLLATLPAIGRFRYPVGLILRLRAGEEVRTLDIQLGKLTLYQLSYTRIAGEIITFQEA